MSLLLGNWKLIAIGLAVMAVSGYVLHCESVKDDWNEAKAIAERQAAENAKQALRDQKAKDRADENYKRDIARLRADVKRLRDSRTSFVPAASPGATDPSRACFDRDQLDAALRAYRAGIIGLLEEGAAAVEGLDEAKAWVQNR